jgi:hypothetical protein
MKDAGVIVELTVKLCPPRRTAGLRPSKARAGTQAATMANTMKSADCALARIAALYKTQGAQVSLVGGLVPEVVLDPSPCHY